MLRFRLLGFPFVVHLYFWIMAAFVSQGVASGPNASLLLLVGIACVFVSITVHELGHALAARHYGVEPAIELYGLGGVTRMYSGSLSRLEGFWVTFCGPAAGFALYLVALAVGRWVLPGTDPGTTSGLAIGTAIGFLQWANLWWTLLNLLPILPLDGGQMLRSVLGPRHLKTTEAIGAGLAGTLATLMVFRGQWYRAALLGYLAFVNMRGNPRVLPGGTSQ